MSKPILAATRQRLLDAFATLGIAPERIDAVGRLPSIAGHLELYHRVDIALDTFPYHGTATTCDALWMGVPVITLAGHSHRSRVGVSLLTNLGHPEWIAATPDEYVQIAQQLAGDLPHRAKMRATQGHRLRASPLMNPVEFTRNLEAAYHQMATDKPRPPPT